MAWPMNCLDAMRHTLLMGCVVMMGCVGGPEMEDLEDPPSMGSEPTSVYLAGENEQGRRLLGSYADLAMTTANGHFRVAGTSRNLPPGRTISVEEAFLVVRNGPDI